MVIVNPKLQSSFETAALRKMAERITVDSIVAPLSYNATGSCNQNGLSQ